MIVKVKKIVSAAMLIQTKIFLKIKGYDENIFLYYEDDDFFLKCKKLNLKLFLVTKSFIDHKKTKTVKETLNLHVILLKRLSTTSLTEHGPIHCVHPLGNLPTQLHFTRNFLYDAVGITPPACLTSVRFLLTFILLRTFRMFIRRTV